MDCSESNIIWIPANTFIEEQTRQIEREFKTSRPRPRNKAMGFRGTDRPRNRIWKPDRN